MSLSRVPRLISTVLLIALLAAACGQSDDSGQGDASSNRPAVEPTAAARPTKTTASGGRPAPPTPAPEDVEESEELTLGTWVGTAEVDVEYFAPCDANFDWIQYDALTHTLDVSVTVSEPLQDDSNAFALAVISDPLSTEAGFTLASSGRFRTSKGPVTLVYWDLRYSGTQVSGELVDPHKAEAAVQSLFYTEKPLDPCSDRLGWNLEALTIDAGATLDGELGPDGGELEIRGQTYDTSRYFEATLRLTRAD
jgi:hypothetical protein